MSSNPVVSDENLQYEQFIIPLKYYKNGDIFNGKSMEVERSLTWNATMNNTDAGVFQFSLISIFVRMLSYDENGNMHLI